MTYQAKVVKGGKLVLPAPLRRELGIKDGDDVIVDLSGGGMRIRSYDATIKEAQRLVREFTTNPSTVDDFIADRRREAARE